MSNLEEEEKVSVVVTALRSTNPSAYSLLFPAARKAFGVFLAHPEGVCLRTVQVLAEAVAEG